MSNEMGSSPGGSGKILRDFCHNDFSQGSTTASAPRSCYEQTNSIIIWQKTSRYPKVCLNLTFLKRSSAIWRWIKPHRIIIGKIVGKLVPDHLQDQLVQLVGLRVALDVDEVVCRKNWTFGRTNLPKPRLRTASSQASWPEDFVGVKTSRNFSCYQGRHLKNKSQFKFTMKCYWNRTLLLCQLFNRRYYVLHSFLCLF